jgi:hypothetical protein
MAGHPIIYKRLRAIRSTLQAGACWLEYWLQKESIFETIHGTTEAPLTTAACPPVCFSGGGGNPRCAPQLDFRFRTEGVRR